VTTGPPVSFEILSVRCYVIFVSSGNVTGESRAAYSRGAIPSRLTPGGGG
jgi:hypothetical protein